MFRRNPPNFPSWPHWIDAPSSVTVFARSMSEVRLALTLVSTLATFFAVVTATDGPNAFKAALISMPKPVTVPVVVASIGILGSLFWFVYSERVGVRFSRDAIEVRGMLRWRRFPRAAADNFKLYIKKRQKNKETTDKPGNTKPAEFVYDVKMRFGLNRVRVGGFGKREKCSRYIEMCRLADRVSQSKSGAGAFEVISVRPVAVLPVEDDADEADSDE